MTMPRTGRPPKPLLERLAEHLQVNYETDCWEWTGYVDDRPGYLPYGRIKIRGNPVPMFIHRIMFEHFVAEIPDGMIVDHICRNARCCNPAHLRILTKSENSDGGWVKQFREATHCKWGHPFNELNTAPRKLHGKIIGRYCKVCRTYGAARHELLIKLGLPPEK